MTENKILQVFGCSYSDDVSSGEGVFFVAETQIEAEVLMNRLNNEEGLTCCSGNGGFSHIYNMKGLQITELTAQKYYPDYPILYNPIGR